MAHFVEQIKDPMAAPKEWTNNIKEKITNWTLPMGDLPGELLASLLEPVQEMFLCLTPMDPILTLLK
jgi:hypothetical protein